jgi:hypothetical protein
MRIVSVKAKRKVYEMSLGKENRGWCIVPHPKLSNHYALGMDQGVILFDIRNQSMMEHEPNIC